MTPRSCARSTGPRRRCRSRSGRSSGAPPRRHRPDRADRRRSRPGRGGSAAQRGRPRGAGGRLPVRDPRPRRDAVRCASPCRWCGPTSGTRRLEPTRTRLRSPSSTWTASTRRGYPEAVFCAGQDRRPGGRDRHRALADQPEVTLFTRASAEHGRAILTPSSRTPSSTSRPAWWPGRPTAAHSDRWPGAGAGRRDLRSPGRPGGAAHRPLPRSAHRAGRRRRRGRSAPDPGGRCCSVRAPSDRRGGRDGRCAAQRGRRSGGGAGGRRTDVGGLRRRVRRAGRPAHHAQLLRTRRGRGQHRQRVRRRPPGRPDRRSGRPTSRTGSTPGSTPRPGVAGDMLLGALVDAGRRSRRPSRPPSTRWSRDRSVDPAAEVTRAGQRATKITVEVIAEDQPHRRWATIRDMLADATSPSRYGARALAIFARLAEAEGRGPRHRRRGGPLPRGRRAGLDRRRGRSRRRPRRSRGDHRERRPGGGGSGRVPAAHGDLPVPVPAVAGCRAAGGSTPGGSGELTTPTGMALVVALAGSVRGPAVDAARVSRRRGGQPGTSPAGPTSPGWCWATGPDRSVRATGTGAAAGGQRRRPRPAAVARRAERLLAAGAADAWLVPIVMKKGRPPTSSPCCAIRNGLDALRAEGC